METRFLLNKSRFLSKLIREPKDYIDFKLTPYLNPFFGHRLFLRLQLPQMPKKTFLIRAHSSGKEGKKATNEIKLV